MENRGRIGIFLLILGIYAYIQSTFTSIESNPGAENITKIVCFIIGTILVIAGILLLIIKKKEVTEKTVDIQKKDTERKGYCKSCGAEILDITGVFCSKCGAPLK